MTQFVVHRMRRMDKVAMLRYFTITVLIWEALTLELTLNIDTEHWYTRMTNLFCGPRRLSTGWSSRSAIDCAVMCKARYPENCYSFLYNGMTRLCIPGGKIGPTEMPVRSSEGQLFVTSECDAYENFSRRSDKAVSAFIAYYKTPRLYSKAIATCQCLDSNLYVAKSPAKFQLLARTIVDNAFGTWLGLDDIAEEGKFVWIDDGQEINETLKNEIFSEGKPDNHNDEDCSSLRWGNPLLNDISCFEQFYFVCEKPLC